MRLSTKSPKLFFGCFRVFLTDIFNTISDSTFYQPFHTNLRLQILNPNIISYPIPGNDDTLDSMQLYLHLFKQAILIGKKKRTEEFNK